MKDNNNSPGQDSDNNLKKEQEIGNSSGYGTDNKQPEPNGPNKSQTNVLNQDGSLADLPDESVDGKGALDGTVGLGT